MNQPNLIPDAEQDIRELNARWNAHCVRLDIPTLGADPVRCSCGWDRRYAGPCVTCIVERVA